MLYQKNQKIQTLKLAENMAKTKEFWTEKNININPTSKIISTSNDHTNSPFLKKYRLLYNRVPTDNKELRCLHAAINNGIINDSMIVITPEIIIICTKKLKPGKDDGDMSFKSDHLIHGGHQLHVVLSTLVNTMLIHVYTPSVLLKSTICQLKKIIKPRYRVVTITGEFLYSIVFVNCMIM